MEPKVKITIGDDGITTIEVLHMQGQSCTLATRELEEAILDTKHKTQTKKDEYFTGGTLQQQSKLNTST